MAVLSGVNMTYNGNQTADLILKPLFKNPLLNALFTIREDVQFQEPLNVLGPLTGILQKYTGCAQLPTTGNAVITQRFLVPQKMQAHVQQCADIFDRTIFEKAKKSGYDENDLQGTRLAKILEALAVEGLTLDLFRLIFFGDKSSADTTMNIIDGVWKKTFAGVADANPANAIIRTTIPDVLAANSARDAFKKLLTTGSPNILKQAVRSGKAMILTTGALFDNYLESKESANNAGVDQAYLNEINGMVKDTMGPVEALMYRGIPVMAMRDWDTEIAAIGGATPNTHRAILWLPGNHYIGTDKYSSFNEFKAWYSDDFDLNNLRARFRADYNYAIGQFTAVAYSNL